MKESIIKSLDKIDILILALLHENDHEGVKGDLFLQKEMFLVVNYIEEMEDYSDFIAHFLGPYSEPVEVSRNNLLAYKLIKKEKGKYYITKRGVEVYKQVKDKLDQDQIKAIRYYKNFLNDLTKDEILTFVYYSFPDYTTESVEKKRLDKKRKRISKSLYEKDKVSLEKGAELAGMPIEEFIDYIKG